MLASPPFRLTRLSRPDNPEGGRRRYRSRQKSTPTLFLRFDVILSRNKIVIARCKIRRQFQAALATIGIQLNYRDYRRSESAHLGDAELAKLMSRVLAPRRRDPPALIRAVLTFITLAAAPE
ncbi:hypothetical protein EVAR_66691_1 [Eumeta japonica]|uniref:Uncharacterized protein n=1 Tax=Eumeta variegata TaxID=151549 RepID=A0A4C1ZNL9_EUMVA|nr:hypothetical protein EVAR_66691_1 [Eumeta japonica]